MPASGSTRRGRPGYDLGTIVDIAASMFVEHGFDATSVDDLARRLNVTKSAIYHHVEGKDALLGVALDHALAGLEAVAASVRALAAPPIERLEALIRGTVSVILERKPYVTLLVRIRGNTDVERLALARRLKFERLGSDLIREAAAAGELRSDIDPSDGAALMFGAAYSLTERPKRRSSASPDQVATTVAAFALGGLRRPGSSAKQPLR